ncbi:hypothetical protein J5X84_40425 [Streptosporangiaceae bacterium NEAU-GS5]|nr:hypothetical protein [Streptosporangiaceae bacterium NEAU-GS5]
MWPVGIADHVEEPVFLDVKFGKPLGYLGAKPVADGGIGAARGIDSGADSLT